MAIMAEAQRLLAPSELWTLGGAITAVVVITNGLHYAFGLSHKLVSLVLSLGIAFGAVVASENHSWQAYVVAVPNGFMIYVSAVGVASMSAAAEQKLRRPSRSEEIERPRRVFSMRWFGRSG